LSGDIKYIWQYSIITLFGYYMLSISYKTFLFAFPKIPNPRFPEIGEISFIILAYLFPPRVFPVCRSWNNPWNKFRTWFRM